jgi:predicted dehydrogenase
MSESSALNVAVIGVGRMGRHHARVYHELPDAKLLSVVDADEDRGAALADKFGCDCLPSADALLEKYPQVQAVSVAVPTLGTKPSPNTDRTRHGLPGRKALGARCGHGP